MSWKTLFILVLVFDNALTEEIVNRNGATLKKANEASLGYASWFVVSVFDPDVLSRRLEELEIVSEELQDAFDNVTHLPRTETDLLRVLYSHVEDKESEKEFENIKLLTEESKKHQEDIEEYIGGDHRDKRSAASSLLSLGAKIGGDLYGKKKSKQKANFQSRFVKIFDNFNRSTQDLVTFSQSQVSLNRKIVNTISDFNDRHKFLSEEVKLLKPDFDSRLMIQFLIQFLKESFQDLITFQKRVLTGLIHAEKGTAAPPFLNPGKIEEILEDFEHESAEKSVFTDKNIAQLYDIVATNVTKVGDKVGVVNRITIPTTNTVGTVWEIITYPILQKDGDQMVFVTLKPEYTHIIVNDDNKYARLNHQDLNSCQHSNFMSICEASPQLWQDRDVPSCESAIFFQDEETVQKLCNFHIEEAKVARVTPIKTGLFHFSIPRKVSVPFQCQSDEKSQIIKLEKSGFLQVGKTCSANYGSTILRSLRNNDVDTFTKKEDSSFFFLEKIRNLKNVSLTKKVHGSQKHTSLDNEDILYSLRKKHEIKEDLEKASQELEEQINNTEEKVDLVNEQDILSETWIENHELKYAEQRSDINDQWILFAVTLVMALFLFLFIILFLIRLRRKPPSSPILP